MTMPAQETPKKTAVISGGGGGLGTALSERLQAEGWRVVVLDLNVDHLSHSKTQLPLKCDITDPRALEDCCAKILACH
ncbi:MAG: SDR family NAD(P)-dependent oxidoreductase, partial [Pseudomonadota bacterium]|nr:SDR family NAD(P)-dependent oxidoreductase [Pseudomonadota bacterium]